MYILYSPKTAIGVRILLVLLLTGLPLLAVSQYNGFMQEIFFDRQPGARAEAMGKSYSATEGDLSAIFYNPAGTASLEGVELYSSFSQPYYLLEKARYSFIGAGLKVHEKLVVGISHNHFSHREPITVMDGQGNIQHTYTPQYSIYTVNASAEPIRNLFIGMNGNHIRWNIHAETPETAWYFDLGVIKKLGLGQDGSGHHVNVGASLINANFARMKLNFTNARVPLPAILRFGSSYKFQTNRVLAFERLKVLQMLISADYQWVVNSDYYSGYHAGTEIQVIEILAIRGGFYREQPLDYGLPGVQSKTISSYGFGLQLPLHKLTNIPFAVKLDYTSLPQPTRSEPVVDFDNFTTFTIRLRWLPDKT